MNEQAYYVDSPWTWKEKLKFKLFPTNYCELPNAPAIWEDVLIINTLVYLDWKDRIRILLTGFIRIKTKTVTKNKIGDHLTHSVAYPVINHRE